MESGVWVAIAALSIQILVAVAGAVWIIAQLKTTTEGLNSSVSQLSRSIEKLDGSLDRHEEKQIDHELRIQRLEHNGR